MKGMLNMEIEKIIYNEFFENKLEEFKSYRKCLIAINKEKEFMIKLSQDLKYEYEDVIFL